MRSLVMSLALTAFMLGGPANAAGPDLSPQEYQLYMDWKEGQEDPRLAKDNEAVRLKKIARQLGVRKKDLQAAIKKCEPLAATLSKDTQTAIKQELGATPLKGRVMDVQVDTRQGHVVAGVKWKCGDQRDHDKEAAYAAWATARGGKVVKTLAIWCVNEKDTKLFSAKIGHTGFTKISKTGVERFATSRYIKLFDGVKRGPHR